MALRPRRDTWPQGAARCRTACLGRGCGRAVNPMWRRPQRMRRGEHDHLAHTRLGALGGDKLNAHLPGGVWLAGGIGERARWVIHHAPAGREARPVGGPWRRPCGPRAWASVLPGRSGLPPRGRDRAPEPDPLAVVARVGVRAGRRATVPGDRSPTSAPPHPILPMCQGGL